MSGESAVRPLLPQTAQMQSFSFAPSAGPPRENQRNYVFVDEHNRHKRLKVMRACEGCRRRKIKCDAATTNSWPCAACIRLKLKCVPPTVSYEKDLEGGEQIYEYLPQNTGVSPVDDYARNPLQSINGDVGHALSQSAPVHYAETSRMYPPAQYVDVGHPALQSYSSIQPPPLLTTDLKYGQQSLYGAGQPSAQALATPESEGSWRNDSANSLAEALGELKIDHTAIAPYIANQKKTLQSAPAVEEYDLQLPPLTGPDATVRIPQEFMPSDPQILQYFEYFFNNIHPYVPVINRVAFYQQWQADRNSISPFLLEAIFACATMMLGEQSQGEKWLALAARHEDSFKDVPRLSTLQAMLLILKARESSPKRGYFYRSWVLVESCVAMAKELELHEHWEIHEDGGRCGVSASECMTNTRIWQTLFVTELMVGAPQGRHDFTVDPSSVCFIPRQLPGVSEGEFTVSRNFTYFAKIVKEVRSTTEMYYKFRKLRKDWGHHPDFVNQNHMYTSWLRQLPQDLQVVFPQDGSDPWISSHFVANMHCYYHLAIIMHHRPQLHMSSGSLDGSWKAELWTCYAAAKSLCRLQEAIMHNFGLAGLLCMQRGIGFTIYAVLTCTMLHLVAITCPDPELNADARDFFVRHMRILEQVSPSWPMAEMQGQVLALRTAFSADINKPFELKSSFPLGSPVSQSNPSPLSVHENYQPREPSRTASIEQPGQVIYHAHPMTPPISTHDGDLQTDSPVAQSLVMMASGQRQQPASTTPIHQVQQEPVQWNPNKIFDQWNVAFGTPPPSTSSQSSPPSLRPAAGNFEVRTPQETHPSGFQALPNISPSHQLPTIQGQLPPPVSYAPANAPYVTPTMWQDAVASSFGDGRLKRGWEYQGMDGMAKRQR